MPRQYPLRDLVTMTGFSPRQIRFYITDRLVPGAGDGRGPNAAYPQETLDRLRLIARYKAIPVPPADRTMTLEEIRRTLDGMAPDEIRRQAEEEAPPLAEKSARQPAEPMEAYCLSTPMLWDEPRSELVDLQIRPLLQQSELLMTDLARHRAPWRHARHDAWRCVKSSLLEIHVKEPVHEHERTQLRRLAESLSQLLGEKKP